jgi:hypothetical protein
MKATHHEIDEMIITSPFDDSQKRWLRMFCERVLDIQFTDKCECDPKDLPLNMNTFTYLNEMGRGVSRCVRCRKKK